QRRRKDARRQPHEMLGHYPRLLRPQAATQPRGAKAPSQGTPAPAGAGPPPSWRRVAGAPHPAARLTIGSTVRGRLAIVCASWLHDGVDPMVKWRGRKGSENVEDRRGAAAGMSGLLILLLRFVFSRFGFGGIIV